MTRKHLLSAAAALALAGVARAQTGAAPKVEHADGVVKTISDGEITLAEAGGKTETIRLLPGWSVAVSKPISVEQIGPGSYLGTTNYAKPDGTGRSTEVHVSPPGVKGPGLDFLMDAAAQTTMTNGVVATVVKSDGGQVLEINYGSGVRRVTVPPGTPVVLNTPGSRDLVKVGQSVRVVTFTPATGGAPHLFITVGENGAPPP
jgi:hypothetical protein